MMATFFVRIVSALLFPVAGGCLAACSLLSVSAGDLVSPMRTDLPRSARTRVQAAIAPQRGGKAPTQPKVYFRVCLTELSRPKLLVGKRLPIVWKTSLEPPGSSPLVESYLGRMGGSDQAAYLRKSNELGLDSRRLKKAVKVAFQQAIGFIAFSRLRVFSGHVEVWDIKFRALTDCPGIRVCVCGAESGTSRKALNLNNIICDDDEAVTIRARAYFWLRANHWDKKEKARTSRAFSRQTKFQVLRR
ncbi:MAG: hypothetical protein ABJN75_09340 [Hoeflea sp.]|uniref:hypothetical protein n=1 Tax=Hoeflea sp. TaxID=1940281 RepID=UPI0032998BB5